MTSEYGNIELFLERAQQRLDGVVAACKEAGIEIAESRLYSQEVKDRPYWGWYVRLNAPDSDDTRAAIRKGLKR